MWLSEAKPIDARSSREAWRKAPPMGIAGSTHPTKLALSDLRAGLMPPSPPPLSQGERGDSRLMPIRCLQACRGDDAAQTAPSGGRAESLRRGTSGMDAARGVRGQGWPLTPCPRSNDGARGPDEVGPDAGASPLVPFGD
ncbi:hypothetical protein PCA10_30720 [Metapseudomonas resinovorans NBRC 106553]|uniref:Uncharacterized protein n=1 Tax=Metapseudomonas resinovorans NBRC 106553 TaxID=1245471 RepID=S6BI29_METRE|nr:hypothetical protein PCA10_30720 [Pseudomonas resinovorans NBRC 106553]